MINKKLVGPHSLPMLEICLSDPKDHEKNKRLLPEVLAWVQLNVDMEKHPLLLHPVTAPFKRKEIYLDHLKRPLWGGTKQLLNLDIIYNPEDPDEEEDD